MSDVFAGNAQEPVKSSSMEAMETANRIGLTGIGFANFRGQNTILKGGFLDNKSSTGIGANSRAKFRPFIGNSMMPGARPGAEQFVGGKNIFGKTTKRGRKMEAKNAKALSLGQPGKTGSFKRFRRGNLTADPRAFMRNPNLSGFGAHSAGFASPNAGGALASISNQGAKLFGKGKNETLFSGGIFSRTGAVTKLERRAARGRSTARGDLNLTRIAKMNTPVSPFTTTPWGIRGPQGRFVSPRATDVIQHGALGPLIDKGAAGQALTVGERRQMAIAGISGKHSKSLFRMMHTEGGSIAAGFGERTSVAASGNIIAATSDKYFVSPLTKALEKNASLMNRALGAGIGMQGQLASSLAPGILAQRTGLMAEEIVQKGIVKTLGVRGAAEAVGAGGARLAVGIGMTTLGKAIPGINLLFAADMAYQLAKLGGLAVKGAINFGKDGMKSMQGNISGGVFGGYKDNEVAATSRARGVAAIQNSRMNARSLLGSEARNDGSTLWVEYNER